MSDTETMAAFGASEKACYLWPDDTLLDKARRAAFCEGAGWAAARIEQLEAALEKSEQWADRYTLPCDVKLPPRTIIRKGCSLKTLITGLIARETIEGEKPPEFAADQQSPPEK